MFPVSLNLVNTSLGSGLYALPFALSILGLPVGVTLILAMAALSACSQIALVSLARYLGVRGYEQVGAAAVTSGDRFYGLRVAILRFLLLACGVLLCASHLNSE